MRPKVLFVGDAGVPSGFGRATHEIVNGLDYHLGGKFDVTILGINYRGDPHEHPYKIYAAEPGGDGFGIGRLIWMCDVVKPDIIVLQNDPWNIPFYTNQLARFKPYSEIPVVASVAVDGVNCMGLGLNALAHAVFWTQFGLDEARLGGYTKPASVIPLGVDLSAFRPMEKSAARAELLPMLDPECFIIGNVNRNQPRKRWDLTMRYFAEWMHSSKIENAYLFLHCAPTGDTGLDVRSLGRYYEISHRLILNEPPTFYGVEDDKLCVTYNCFDVSITTTQGEGFGLPTLEAMACGVPVIAPDWSALGEWAKGASWLVPCTSTAIGPPYVNVIGGVPDRDKFIAALRALYGNLEWRKTNGQAGLERAQQPRFRWANIAKAWEELLLDVLKSPKQETLKIMVGA